MAPTALEKLWDVNPSFGGPILRDRLWFFGSFRHQGNRQKINMFVNTNAGDATKWTYEPTTKQAIDDGTWKNTHGARHVAGVTAQQDRWLDERPVPLSALHRGRLRASGLGFTASIASPEAQSYRTKTTRASSAR